MKIGPIFVFAATLSFLTGPKRTEKRSLKGDRVRYSGPVLKTVMIMYDGEPARNLYQMKYRYRYLLIRS